MLSVRNLKVTYNGNIKAIKGVDLDVKKGEIVVLIGSQDNRDHWSEWCRKNYFT